MPRPRLVVVATAALVAVAACAVSVEGLRHPAGGPPIAVGPVSTPTPVTDTPVTETTVTETPVTEPAGVSPPAVAVLRTWDRRRSRAWARGDPTALAALYVPGSAAGAHDAAMLRSWTRRGLRVDRLAVQLLAVDELARTPTRWRLRVTDRVAAGVAVGPGPRRALPADLASTRTLVLQRWAGAWRVASVTTSAAPGAG